MQRKTIRSITDPDSAGWRLFVTVPAPFSQSLRPPLLPQRKAVHPVVGSRP
jgi:hypothetical protein